MVPIRSRVVSLKEDSVDKSKVGIGAAMGGILGAVLDGGKGALIGVLVGGGGAMVGTKGDEVELPAGTVLTLRLERPVPAARR
jgi:outer membrane lipoprotein SlyB